MPRTRFLALVALAALAFAAVTSVAADGVPKEFVVNVSPAGFDPSLCKISRGDHVSWKNTGSTPIRVVWPDPNGGTPLFDSGDIKPGETSRNYSGFVFPGHYNFQDAANTSHQGVVITPTWSNDWEEDCTPTGAPPPPGPMPRRSIVPALAKSP